MSFIQRERDRISAAIAERQEHDDISRQLFAAQQALSWAIEPEGFKSPYAMIMGVPAETEDCPSLSCLPSS